MMHTRTLHVGRSHVRATGLVLAVTLGVAFGLRNGGCEIENPDHCEHQVRLAASETVDGSEGGGVQTRPDPGSGGSSVAAVCGAGSYCTVGVCNASEDGCVSGDGARDYCSLEHCWQKSESGCGAGRYCSQWTQAEVPLTLCADEADAGETFVVRVAADGCTEFVLEAPMEQDEGDTDGQVQETSDLRDRLVGIAEADLGALDPNSRFCRDRANRNNPACKGECPIVASSED